MWRDLPLVVAFVGVCASIASFIALMEIRAHRLGRRRAGALEPDSHSALDCLGLGGRAAGHGGAWQAQIAAAAVAVAFVVVALVKVYSASSTPAGRLANALSWVAEAQALGVGALAFGLIGRRASSSAGRIAFLVALGVTVGFAGYATSLKFDFKASVWYLAAGTAASLAGSAAARMHRH